MAIVVLDSNNMEAVLADAQGELAQQKSQPSTNSEQQAQRPSDADDQQQTDSQQHDDDVEDENGLTEAQKRELSSKMLKAIGKKHRQVKEAEEFAAAQYNERKMAERRYADLEARLREIEGKQQTEQKDPTQTQEPSRPNRVDFATDDQYVEALADWKTEQKFREREAEQQRQAEEQRRQDVARAAQEQIARASELIEDFEEVTQSATVMIPPAVVNQMYKSELFAELGYYFAKNPDVAVSLSKLSDADQLVRLGRIEATLQPFAAKTTNKPSDGDKPSAKSVNGKRETAPSEVDTDFVPSNRTRVTAPVIKPISTADGVQVEQDPSEMNTREMINSWQKQNKANFALRKRH